MLKENLKQEIDKLSDEQLKIIADLIASREFETGKLERVASRWQTPEERARDFRAWISQLPFNSPSLSDRAFSRDSIYE
ncbi:MAG: hypothetical protein AB4352_21565 [Hormoscilla sp.]